MTESVAVVVHDVSLGVVSASGPKELVARATEAADALAGIIEQKKLYAMIQNKKHVVVEGWTTLAAMMGCLPREVSMEEHEGTYIATVELCRIGDGMVLSRASAECGAAEPMWRGRPPYARRSMAATRATSKACRLAFSWVMVLAGYAVTPAEEMPQDERGAGEASPNRKEATSEHPDGREANVHSRSSVQRHDAVPSVPRDAVAPPAPAGGFDATKKVQLTQKNIERLLIEADGSEDVLLMAVFRAVGKRPDSLKAATWPPMNAEQYEKIREDIKPLAMPEAVTEDDQKHALYTEIDALLKDNTIPGKLRVKVQGEYESRDDDQATVKWLTGLVSELKAGKAG